MFQEHVNQEQVSDLLNDKNTHMRNGMSFFFSSHLSRNLKYFSDTNNLL
jgi:hypothetical protein